MPSDPVAESLTGSWVRTSPAASKVSSTSCGGGGDGLAAGGGVVLAPSEGPVSVAGVQPATVTTSAGHSAARARNRRARTVFTCGCYGRPTVAASVARVGRSGRRGPPLGLSNGQRRSVALEYCERRHDDSHRHGPVLRLGTTRRGRRRHHVADRGHRDLRGRRRLRQGGRLSRPVAWADHRPGQAARPDRRQAARGRRTDPALDPARRAALVDPGDHPGARARHHVHAHGHAEVRGDAGIARRQAQDGAAGGGDLDVPAPAGRLRVVHGDRLGGADGGVRRDRRDGRRVRLPGLEDPPRRTGQGATV